MLGFVLFTLIFQLAEGKGTTCPDGWITFRGSCYLFGAGNMTFTASEQYCRQHKGGHLVHVNDALENAFLKDEMRDRKESHWWMGLTDELVEGVWQWFDTDTVATFTDFHAGDVGAHLLEDCACFYGQEGFEWADFRCTYTGIRPLCELPSLACEEEVVIG